MARKWTRAIHCDPGREWLNESDAASLLEYEDWALQDRLSGRASRSSTGSPTRLPARLSASGPSCVPLLHRKLPSGPLMKSDEHWACRRSGTLSVVQTEDGFPCRVGGGQRGHSLRSGGGGGRRMLSDVQPTPRSFSCVVNQLGNRVVCRSVERVRG